MWFYCIRLLVTAMGPVPVSTTVIISMAGITGASTSVPALAITYVLKSGANEKNDFVCEVRCTSLIYFLRTRRETITGTHG